MKFVKLRTDVRLPERSSAHSEAVGNKISKPSHYMGAEGLECRDVQKNFVPSYERYGGMMTYDAGNVIKYILRAPEKNGVEDLKKARQYLDWMIEEAER